MEYRTLAQSNLSTSILSFSPIYRELEQCAVEMFVKEWDTISHKRGLSNDQKALLDETRKQLNHFGINQKFDFDV